MFATLVAAYPRTPLAGGPFRLREAYRELRRGRLDAAGFHQVQDALVREVIGDQIEAGLGLLTDGHVRGGACRTLLALGLEASRTARPARHHRASASRVSGQGRVDREPVWRGPIHVGDWQFADSVSLELSAARGIDPLPVKVSFPGPYTLARVVVGGTVSKRAALTTALAEALNQEVRSLAEAGVPVIQLDEDGFTCIGRDDSAERELARDALRRVTDGVSAAHLCLAVTGGSAEHAGSALLYDLPFSSYLLDVIAGPDNWRLIADAPTERGVILGVADAREPTPDDEAVMVWAARYAASINGRGIDRVGLCPSAGLERLLRDDARSKIAAIAAAARTAAITDDRRFRAALDPRAVHPAAGGLRGEVLERGSGMQ